MQHQVTVHVPYIFSLYTLEGGSGEAIRCFDKERQALLNFKKELIDDGDILHSWGSEENKRECCRWRGVECSNMTGHVTSLHLNLETHEYGRALRGNLSNALVDLQHLISLDLSSNYFHDIEIPDFIGSLNKLWYLNLHSCSLTGKVPSQLGNLTSLRTLDLGRNDGLVIQNLDWISDLSSLFLIDLSGASFTESLEMVVSRKMPIITPLNELHLEGCIFPNDASHSHVDVSGNSSFASLSVLDLSGVSLTSSTFRWLFNISTNLATIDLTSNELDGTIPDAFGQKLVFLKNLDLSYNRFEGGIPITLGNSRNLKKLDLSYNQLTEPLPKFIGTEMPLEFLDLSSNQLRRLGHEGFPKFSKLKVLDVSFNPLEGTISESSLSKLHNLKKLDLSYTSLFWNLSHDWTPPFQLEVLNLACCNIGPHFPKWVRTQSKVSLLDLSCANISSELPQWFWDSFPVLELLNLSHNHISGVLPEFSPKFVPSIIDLSFNEFSSHVPSFHRYTRVLNLSNNRFLGTISLLCTTNHDEMQLLDLSNNHLSGPLPTCLENNFILILDLSNNNFSGEIPKSWSGIQFLTLHLGNNNLSGELPSSFQSFLRVLDVGGNKLTGNIPATIGTNLASFNLRGNNFFGSIPPEICYLTEIQILDLSRNNLSGRFPLHCFTNVANFIQKNRKRPFSKLHLGYDPPKKKKQLYAGYLLKYDMVDKVVVQWKRNEYEYSKTLYLLTLIDLSDNRIEGNISAEIFQLEGLISLNLSRNHLTGNINPAIHVMKSLECLDLSRNQLSGEIPASLAALSSLTTLDLSNNNFSGKIPQGIQLESFNASTYAGNIGLCGHPLQRCPNDGAGTSSDHHLSWKTRQWQCE